MKTIITIFILLFAYSAEAQWKLYVQPYPKQSGKQFQINGGNGLKISIPLSKDTIIYIPQQHNPINRMPNALSAVPQARKENLVLKGNNGKGFSIYQSPIDKMQILVPDSTNTAK